MNNIMEGVLSKVPTGASSLLVPAAACIGGCIAGGLIMKKTSSKSGPTDKRPEKWIKVGQITELNIYPVKGMPGTPVNEAVLGRLGLKATSNPKLRDRTFIIVDKLGKFISLGKLPVLALTRVSVEEGNKLHLSYTKDTSKDIIIDIPSSIDSSGLTVVNLYGEKLKGMDCGDKVAAWLTTITEIPDLRLIHHVSEEPQRGPVSRNTRFPQYRELHTGAFQDETSYLLMTEETLSVVNAELAKPVTHTNFRPTMVVAGIPEPFAEDSWGYIRIGSGDESPVLKSSLPCARCQTTTIDPETGTIRDDGEPLKTLYRLKRPIGDARTTKLASKSAILGNHFGIFEGAQNKVIRVGDPVYAALL